MPGHEFMLLGALACRKTKQLSIFQNECNNCGTMKPDATIYSAMPCISPNPVYTLMLLDTTIFLGYDKVIIFIHSHNNVKKS